MESKKIFIIIIYFINSELIYFRGYNKSDTIKK